MVRIFSYLLDFAKPLFRKGIISMNDIRRGTHLSGRVTNVTTFGSFGALVDIGVGRDGLIIHKSAIPFCNYHGAWDIVDVVCVNEENNRIELRLK